MGFFDSVGSALSGGLGGLGMSVGKALWDQKETGRAKAYATKMSNTAHQREVKDLRAAGLNPILSAGGKGASTPTVGATPGPDPSQGIAGLSQASSAKTLRSAQANLAEANASSAKVRARMDENMLKMYEENKTLQKLVDASRLGEESGLGGWLRSAGRGIMNVLNFKKPPTRINKTWNDNSRNHSINQKINTDGYIDTKTGEMIPLKPVDPSHWK